MQIKHGLKCVNGCSGEVDIRLMLIQITGCFRLNLTNGSTFQNLRDKLSVETLLL